MQCWKVGREGQDKVQAMNEVPKRKLGTVSAVDAALATTQPPRTVADWRMELDRLQAVMKGPPRMPGCSGAYRGVWAIRCALIYSMRRAGIERLEVDRCNVRDVLGNFPDQKKQVLALAGGKRMGHLMMKDLFSDARHRANHSFTRSLAGS